VFSRKIRRALGGSLICVLLTWTAGRLPAADEPAAIVWRVDAVRSVGGHATEVIGAPRAAEGAVVFDGVKDGLLVLANPLKGMRAFTVEALFKPEEGGPAEQRFWHAQDAAGSRALLETRLDGKGAWWLDTFLFQTGKTGRTLIDPKKTHPTGAWYWVALRYDGTTMTSFVDGMKELQGEVEFGPMGDGKLSLGVRQTLVHWFKGAIREVRVTPAALPEEKLQRAK
jgi:hypothetical protein